MSDISYHEFLQILLDAEERVKTTTDDGIRTRSQETVDLCLEKLNREGLTREAIETDVRDAISHVERVAQILRVEIHVEERGGVPMWIKIKDGAWTAPLDPVNANRHLHGMVPVRKRATR